MHNFGGQKRCIMGDLQMANNWTPVQNDGLEMINGVSVVQKSLDPLSEIFDGSASGTFSYQVSVM